MILRPPLANCPVCKYSLQGLPAAHRCPECGFAYDEQTIIFRPKAPWGPSASLLSGELIAFYFIGPAIMALTTQMMGMAVGVSVLFLLFAGIPAVTLCWVLRAHRRGRFVAVRRDGLVLRNLGDLIALPWPECLMVAMNDIQPWVQRRGEDQTISLRGMFDSLGERQVFECVATAARSGRDLLAASRIPIAKFTPQGSMVMRPRDRKTLIRTGAGILGVAFVLIIAAVLFPTPPEWLTIIAGVLGWTGGIILLIGLWRSDRKA